MESSGGWLFIISLMFLTLALSLGTSSSLRCERGLGNCVDDEPAVTRQLKKRGQNCRFGCIGGGKREAEEKKPLKLPENDKQTAFLRKREVDEEKRQKEPSPSCARFFCGKKRSAESPKNEFNTANEVVSKRKPFALCLRFGGCKRAALRKGNNPARSEMERQEEETGLPLAPNEETKEGIPPVDQDDTRKPRCWRFGCGKRSTPFQTSAENILKRFYRKPIKEIKKEKIH